LGKNQPEAAHNRFLDERGKGAVVLRDELRTYLDQLLEIGKFSDYSPNGLQVEGRAEVKLLVTGVTASQALLDAAAALSADALLVHHGWFWRGEDGRVTGHRRTRLATLLRHDINLFAYHLPLDAHAQFGNNVQLGRLLGWRPDTQCGAAGACWLATVDATTAGALRDRVAERLERVPQLIGESSRPVRRIAWCTGAAQGYFEQAIAAGADLYLSGEISEPTVHLARESGVAYLAAGHHATERYGVRALGHHLKERFGLDCRYIDIDNPV
jgi:dinuclear metal center YbgI/SA1388 family protein